MNPLIKLGATILSVIVKVASKNENICNVVDGAFQISDIIEQDFFEKRNIDRTSQDITDNIAKSCYQILSHHSITEERANAFYEDVIIIINRANLSYELIITNKASADSIYRLLLPIAREYKSHFDSNEYDIFLRLIRHVSGIIVNSALESPRFTNHGINHIASSIEELHRKTDTVLLRLEEIDRAVSHKTEDFQKFERNYRNDVAEKYGWIQLLGAKSLDREEKRYKLSIAYVSLAMQIDRNPERSISITDMFSTTNLLWIDGEAGSGKSTLMQWIAVQSASNNGDTIPDLKDTVPYLIELRKQDVQNISIRKAVETVMLINESSMPENWISHNIDDLAKRYSKIKIIVTSRPQATKSINKSFTRCRLLPMTRKKVDSFLQYWHEAVLIDRLEIGRDEASSYMQKLAVQIDNSESIRRMVTNPLLCAMICALHYKNGSIMSRERNELYDDCCKMLFGNRDYEKEVQAYAHINLSYDEKKTILSQLAYWMMKNNVVVISEKKAITQIGRSIAGLRQSSQQYHPEELYHYFLERSGILRSPEDGQVDFIHKSFQEYLAAYEIHKQDDWGFIASKADDINWYETLILSMGFASINDSEFVIKRILGNKPSEKNIVVAAACGANAPRLSPKLRESISSRIEGILPPQTAEASERLSSAGEFVVPYLQCKKTLTPDERYYSLRTLRLISSPQALFVAGSYLSNSADNDEISLIGSMLESFTKKEIQSVDFEKNIYEYLKSASTSNDLYISESFLRILWTTPLSELGEYTSKFSKVTITNFQNRLYKNVMALFSGVKSLTLIGRFKSISSITEICKQLDTLVLCDYSKSFDFYETNNYSFASLTSFHLYTNNRVYITGYDCDAISNITDLGIYFYNSTSEVHFDGFGSFTNLKSIALYHEDIPDFNLSYLIYDTSLASIKLKFPKYISRNIMNMVKERLVDDIPNVAVQYDDDPFGFTQTVY